MELESRTSKSLKNAKVALFFYVVNLGLQFFSRKVFLDYLGAEVLGLNTATQNLLSFLNLAELGISTAVAYTLYKPLFQKDRQTINEIVSLQGWFYRKVAYIVIAGACVLMLFFPLIFQKAQLPLWYAYGSFIVLLSSSLLGYFINYREILLTADQKQYKITSNIQGVKVIKVILQIGAISYFEHGYIFWLLLEFCMAGISAFILNRVIKREYPWLRTCVTQSNLLKTKYSVIIIKTKQLFFHRISWFALDQISPLVIYAYTSLTIVAIYGNYTLIMSGIRMLLNALITGISAGVGNLVAEGSHEKIKDFFWELTVCRIWMASVVCYGIYKLAHSFISLWIGKEFVLDQSSFVILIFITFILMTRTNTVFIEAYGLFQDIWAPIAEVALNLFFSIIGGYYYGLTGILGGGLVSLLVITYCWKPYFLYTWGFKENVAEYVVQQSKYLLILGLAIVGTEYILICLSTDTHILNYYDWIKYALQVVLVYIILSLLLFYLFDKGMKDFVKRFKRIYFN